MLKSIEAALKDDRYPSSLLFAQEFFTQILGPQSEPLKHPSSILLKKGFCQLVKEMASFFVKFPQHLN